MSSRDLVPPRVYVSGMPLLCRGWNGWYERDKDSDLLRYNRVENVPTYWCITIFPTAIVKDYQADEWLIVVPCVEDGTTPFRGLVKKERGVPLGAWDNGVFVSAEESPDSWKQSNSGLVRAAITLLLCAAVLVRFFC